MSGRVKGIYKTKPRTGDFLFPIFILFCECYKDVGWRFIGSDSL